MADQLWSAHPKHAEALLAAFPIDAEALPDPNTKLSSDRAALLAGSQLSSSLIGCIPQGYPWCREFLKAAGASPVTEAKLLEKLEAVGAGSLAESITLLLGPPAKAKNSQPAPPLGESKSKPAGVAGPAPSIRKPGRHAKGNHFCSVSHN